MNITVGQLVACGIGPTQARMFADPLTSACSRFDIDTPARIGAFIGQCKLETRGFEVLEEGLYYKNADVLRHVFPSRVPDLQVAAHLVKNPKGLANYVYANRNGNGDEASGDGWAFRGRGLIQLTGRANYADASLNLARHYVDYPDLVAQPEDACLTAAWYWHNHKLNVFADVALYDDITRAINGRAMLHADLRRQYSEEAVGVFQA